MKRENIISETVGYTSCTNCYQLAANAIALHKMLNNLPDEVMIGEWMIERLASAVESIQSITDYLGNEIAQPAIVGGIELAEMYSQTLPIADNPEYKRVADIKKLYQTFGGSSNNYRSDGVKRARSFYEKGLLKATPAEIQLLLRLTDENGNIKPLSDETAMSEMTSGGTGVGAIATSAVAPGKMRKRLQELDTAPSLLPSAMGTTAPTKPVGTTPATVRAAVAKTAAANSAITGTSTAATGQTTANSVTQGADTTKIAASLRSSGNSQLASKLASGNQSFSNDELAAVLAASQAK